MILNKTAFTVIFTTSEDEKYPANELNQHGPTVRGWQSAKNCQFPQEIIMKLTNPITLHRIQVLAHQYLIPEKVEIWATNNLSSQSQSEPIIEQAFRYLGYITLADNQVTNFKSRELKSVSLPSHSATHLKLRLSKNHENAFNVDNQVSLIAINVLGTELNETVNDANSNEPEKVTVSSQAYTFSPYDDLAFEMYVDTEVADYIRQLDTNKQKAVQEERFEFARKLKIVIEKLREAGEKLGKYDLEKRHAIDMEDYERARRKKVQGDEFRKQIYQQLQVHLLLETNGPNSINDEYTDAELATLALSGTSDSSILSPPPPNGISSSLQVPIRSSSREAVNGSPAIASPLHHLSRPKSPGTGKNSPTNNNIRGNSLRRRNKPSAPGKSSFEAYEERTVPALRHSHTNEFLRECHMENPPETKNLSKLNDREKKQAALPILVFGNELVEKFYSKQFSDKEDGLNRLKDELRTYDSNPTHTANKTARAAIFLLHRALRDKVFSVYSLSAEVIRLFFTEFILGRVSQTEIARSVDRLLPELLAKSGDPTPRIHNMAIHTILSMADCEQVRELHLIPVHLTRPVSSSTHPRLAQSRIEMVEQLILNHGISTDKQSGLTCRVLAEFGSSGLHHPAEPVRKVAERVLLLVYKVNPRLVRKQLPPDDEITRRNLLYRHLYHEFDKVDLQRKKDLIEKNKSFTFENTIGNGTMVTKSKSSSNVTSSYIISNDGSNEFNRFDNEVSSSKLVESKSMYSTKLLNDGEEDCLSVRFENIEQNKNELEEAGSSNERRATFKEENDFYQIRRNTIGGEVQKIDNKNQDDVEKRNSASSTTSGVSSPSPSDYSQKEGYKQCIFCSKPDTNCNESGTFSFSSSTSRSNYFTDDQLNSHYWRWCPMLTRCVDCDQVIEISTLTIHRLLECDNSQSYRQCRRCREAIPLSDYVVHVSSMECVEALSAHTKCPLCHCNVPQGDLNWKDHLMGPKACEKNTRAPGNQGIQTTTLKRDRKI